MPQFKTSTGRVNVGDWGYQLQADGGLKPGVLAKEAHDMIVMDFSKFGAGDERFSAPQIAKVKDGSGGRSLAVSYMSIGEASEFRDHWDPDWTQNGKADSPLTNLAPDWLGPTNPDWPESRKVRYWDEGWQSHIFNDAKTGWLDQIVKQGFDAAYLDIVDAYYYWAQEVPNAQREASDPAKGDEFDAAKRMIDFIVEMTAHARETNPDFFVILQNGEFILDALEGAAKARKAALLDAIGGIAVEDLYFRGGKDENNKLKPDQDRIDVLQRDFLKNGIPVFVVDYVNRVSKVDKFEKLAIGDGFIPYAAPDRALDVMGDTLGGGRAGAGNDLLTGNNRSNTFNGRGGDDLIDGFGGRDVLKGGDGSDWIYGSAGADKITGGKGKDYLFGGPGNDIFKFAPRQGRNEVLDFGTGVDKLDLSKFGFANKAQALSQFYEIGGKHNDVAGFEHQGSVIVVHGRDLDEVKAADLII